MKAATVHEVGSTRVFWFETPVFVCTDTWGNQNVPLNGAHCNHSTCVQRVQDLLEVEGVYYVGPTRDKPQSVYVTLSQTATWDEVQESLERVFETFNAIPHEELQVS